MCDEEHEEKGSTKNEKSIAEQEDILQSPLVFWTDKYINTYNC